VSDHYPIELLIQSSSYQTSRSKRETSSFYHTLSSRETTSGLRVGAFNVRVFGQKKVADEDVLSILVQVSVRYVKCVVVELPYTQFLDEIVTFHNINIV